MNDDTIMILGLVDTPSLDPSNTKLSDILHAEQRRNHPVDLSSSTSKKMRLSKTVFDSTSKNYIAATDGDAGVGTGGPQQRPSSKSSIKILRSTRRNRHQHLESLPESDVLLLPKAFKGLRIPTHSTITTITTTTTKRLMLLRQSHEECNAAAEERTRQLSLFLEFAMSSSFQQEANPALGELSQEANNWWSHSSNNDSCYCSDDDDDDDNKSIDSLDVAKTRLAKVPRSVIDPEDDDLREEVDTHRPMTFILPLLF